MNVRITSPLKGGSLQAPYSKSHLHRMMFASFLSHGELFTPDSCELDFPESDVATTYNILSTLKSGQKNTLFNCNDSGTTLRFLIPLLSVLGHDCTIVMSRTLTLRPIVELLDALNFGGAHIKQEKNKIFVSGRLKPGVFQLPGDISSQYISGLLFALPLLSEESKIQINSPLKSKPYVDMTLDVLRLFGISIAETRQNNLTQYIIPPSQHYKALSHTQIKSQLEGDWSNAAFWILAGLIGKQPIEISGLNLNDSQGDKVIFDLVSNLKGHITYEDKHLIVSPSSVESFDFDVEQNPDISVVLAGLSALSRGTGSLKNVNRLKFKESNRVSSIIATINGLGGSARLDKEKNNILIQGKKILSGGTVDSFNDHRIAMLAAILRLGTKEAVTILNAHAINKSYPSFFSTYEALGGIIEYF